MTGEGAVTGRRVGWPRRLAAGVTVWFVVCGGALFLGMRPHPVLLALTIATAGAALLLFLDTSGSAPSTWWRVTDHDPVREPGEDPRLGLLTRVVGSHLVAHDPGGQLREELLTLLDQRLVAHHGISRLADPERAAALLDPELRALVAQQPPYPRMGLDRIDVLIDRIEEL